MEGLAPEPQRVQLCKITSSIIGWIPKTSPVAVRRTVSVRNLKAPLAPTRSAHRQGRRPAQAGARRSAHQHARARSSPAPRHQPTAAVTAAYAWSCASLSDDELAP